MNLFVVLSSCILVCGCTTKPVYQTLFASGRSDVTFAKHFSATPSNQKNAPSPEPLPDMDGDGIPDRDDNCMSVINREQTDSDGDGIGEACDPDIIGSPDAPTTASPDRRRITSSVDELTIDQIMNLARVIDSDGDGHVNAKDNCIGVSNPDQKDTDDDGFGDACDRAPLRPIKSKNGKSRDSKRRNPTSPSPMRK
ncbi:MAG: thrombospondin type 3 repeat-containing protein [Pyrinomonadaceae bacterium]|nr:thrombospondin type 3 repeat-containing protein [Pyrinomonadaceae bacterium]